MEVAGSPAKSLLKLSRWDLMVVCIRVVVVDVVAVSQIPQAESTTLTERQDVVCERKQEVTENEYFWPEQMKDRVAINWGGGKLWGREAFLNCQVGVVCRQIYPSRQMVLMFKRETQARNLRVIIIQMDLVKQWVWQIDRRKEVHGLIPGVLQDIRKVKRRRKV